MTWHFLSYFSFQGSQRIAFGGRLYTISQIEKKSFVKESSILQTFDYRVSKILDFIGKYLEVCESSIKVIVFVIVVVGLRYIGLESNLKLN